MLKDSLKKPGKWLVLLLLLVFWGRLVNTAASKSVTFDETLHIFQGALYWEGDRLYSVVQNPPLVNALIGVPVSLAFEPNFPYPIEIISNWLQVSKTFMWQINSNGLQMIWTGRLAIMLLSMMLGTLLHRWARQLFKSTLAGLLALFLYTFDPNILAHSFLATTDLGLAFFFVLAAYLVWQYWRDPGQHNRPLYLGVGIAIGLVIAAKFSGIIMVPALIIVGGYRWITRSKRQNVAQAGTGNTIPVPGLLRTISEIGGWLLIAAMVFLVIYRFDFETLNLDFTWQRDHLLTGHSAYFFGHQSTRGWLLYFPVVFLIKTPIPVLILLLIGSALFVIRRPLDWERLWPLAIAAGVAGAGLNSRVNIGYRYLLPILPLLYIGLAQLGQPGYLRSRYTRAAIGIALLLTAIVSLWFHPHYLAYFNQLAGGPDNGWKIVVDSNIDWGQDIQALSDYLTENDISMPNISYFGSSTLEAYGIQGKTILAWPLAKENPLYDSFYPDRPAPGVYVFSVTQLQGVYLDNPDRFRWFLERAPKDKVGYSLFVYDVAADGGPVGLALSGIGISTIEPADYDRAFDSNDVRPRWFNAPTSFLWPGGGGVSQVWSAIGDGHFPEHPFLRRLYSASPALSGEQTIDGVRWRYHLYSWPASPIQALLQNELKSDNLFTDLGWSSKESVRADEWQDERLPLDTAVFGETLKLLGYETNGDVSPGQSLELLTLWHVQQVPAVSLKIFVHLLDGDGEIVAQHDGLDVLSGGLMAGDELAQLHAIQLPDNLPDGNYALQLGVYEAETGARLPVDQTGGHKVMLHKFIISRGNSGAE